MKELGALKLSEQAGKVLGVLPNGIRVRFSRGFREELVKGAALKAMTTGRVPLVDEVTLFFARPEEHARIWDRLERAKQQYNQEQGGIN